MNKEENTFGKIICRCTLIFLDKIKEEYCTYINSMLFHIDFFNENNKENEITIEEFRKGYEKSLKHIERKLISFLHTTKNLDYMVLEECMESKYPDKKYLQRNGDRIVT